MATCTSEHDRLIEQARGLAVSLEAENALVASLVLAADERGLLDHATGQPLGAGHYRHRPHECPSCQLLAWAKATA